MSWYYDYKPTIETDKGIKAKSKRGDFVKNWWATGHALDCGDGAVPADNELWYHLNYEYCTRSKHQPTTPYSGQGN
jgi:hypothetical protein